MKQIEVKRDDGVELEIQFILRIPEEPAKALREAIQSGSNSLKERLNIKLESDLRYGEVRFDHWLMHAKVVDLPTIIESLKTIDNKSFYKTADICQMMICKYEPDIPSADEESPNKAKKKDPNKVDKKFLWPHGITPPCKNIRKRRFRKTLKKKYVEAPEIEKEVKRLLRVDNEAVNVKFEIINEDIEQSKNLNNANGSQNDTIIDQEKDKIENNSNKFSKQELMAESENDIEQLNEPITRGVGEHDIFGEVSSSDDDEQQNVDVEETSRLSQDDSRLSDFSENVGAATAGTSGRSNVDKMITEFNKSMFSSKSQKSISDQNLIGSGSDNQNQSAQQFYGQQQQQQQQGRNRDSDDDFDEPQMSREQINIRIMELRRQIDDLKTQHTQKSQEISSIQNPTLRQRMQETRDNLLSQIVDKEMEIQDLENMLRGDVS